MAARRVEYIPEPEPLPGELDTRKLKRRVASIALALGAVALIAAFAPGLGEVRDRLADAQPAWLALAVALELGSCLSYVLMFKPVFCGRMTWRSSYELGMSELAAGSLVPASGAAGLALGAWALRKGGMPAEEIARRSVAFFVLKSGTNFVAVAVLGILMFAGVGPELSPLLTLLPAILSIATLGLVALAPELTGRVTRGPRWFIAAIAALDQGVRESGRILRRREWKVIAGSLGYWAFDNAVLWATFHAFGESPPITLILMGYLIGQLGGLLPIPGGIGGIDGGLIGTLIVYGIPAAPTAAAVCAYRVILFWLPLTLGGIAFAQLRRGLEDPARADLCDPLRRPRRARRGRDPVAT